MELILLLMNTQTDKYMQENRISVYAKYLRYFILCVLFLSIPINVYGFESHTLTVVVHDHGEVSYNGNNYRDETFSIEVSEVEYVHMVLGMEIWLASPWTLPIMEVLALEK